MCADGRMLPSTLSPCFAKAALSIINVKPVVVLVGQLYFERNKQLVQALLLEEGSPYYSRTYLISDVEVNLCQR